MENETAANFPFFAEIYKCPSEPKEWLRGANEGKYGAFLGGCNVMERYYFSVQCVEGKHTVSKFTPHPPKKILII